MADEDLKAMLESIDRTAPDEGDTIPPEKTDDEVLAELEAGSDENEVEYESLFGGEEKQKSTESDESDSEQQPELFEPDEAFDKAFAALIRDGWSSQDLKEMARDTVVRIGDKRAKVQEDYDKAYADLRGLKSKLTTKEEGDEESDQDDSGAPTLEGGLLARLTESFGERAANDLIALMQASVKPVAERLQSHAQGMESIAEAETARELTRVRSELVKELPQLKNDSHWAAFREESRELARSDRYRNSTIEDVMRDYAKITFGVLPSEIEQRTESNDARSNGQMSTTTSTKPTAQLSPEERDDKILAAIEAGLPMSVIRRKLGV
jgi:hypothetical protein